MRSARSEIITGQAYTVTVVNYQYDNLQWMIFQLALVKPNNYIPDSIIVTVSMCVAATILMVLVVMFITNSLYMMSEELEKVSEIPRSYR
jgi:hypothetical protein